MRFGKGRVVVAKAKAEPKEKGSPNKSAPKPKKINKKLDPPPIKLRAVERDVPAKFLWKEMLVQRLSETTIKMRQLVLPRILPQPVPGEGLFAELIREPIDGEVECLLFYS